jgi:cell division septation protein DedD
VGGTVNSPSKILSFSENLTIDDGILINDISLTHGISIEDAQKVVDAFVEKIKSLLNQREIVTLSGVGRLYKNYVQKIQFLPDSTNFNAESYGLPPLQFSPIARSREVTEDLVPETQTYRESSPAANETPDFMPPPTMPESTFAPQRSKKSSMGIILGVVFFLISIAAGIWYWQQHKKVDETPSTTTPLEVPVPKTAKAAKTTTDTPVTTKITEKSVQESVNERIAAARKQVSSGRECILIIATLSQSENAEKLRKTLEKEGYNVYFKQKNGFVIGVQFNYSDPSEIQDNINDLKRLTGVSSILIKKK